MVSEGVQQNLETESLPSNGLEEAYNNTSFHCSSL
jgi:hypothetical protein